MGLFFTWTRPYSLKFYEYKLKKDQDDHQSLFSFSTVQNITTSGDMAVLRRKKINSGVVTMASWISHQNQFLALTSKRCWSLYNKILRNREVSAKHIFLQQPFYVGHNTRKLTGEMIHKHKIFPGFRHQIVSEGEWNKPLKYRWKRIQLELFRY